MSIPTQGKQGIIITGITLPVSTMVHLHPTGLPIIIRTLIPIIVIPHTAVITIIVHLIKETVALLQFHLMAITSLGPVVALLVILVIHIEKERLSKCKIAMKMNKKQSIVVCVVCAAVMSATVCPAIAGEIIKSLPEKEVKPFLQQLNSQGVMVTYNKDVKEDKIKAWADDLSFFTLDGSDSGYSLYRADINNDSKDEYVLCSAAGSGSFFDIEYIYQDRDGKLVDIYNEIKIPLRRLVRDSEKGKYDLEEGYTGFMNGSIRIEKDNDKVFFTLGQVTREYNGKGFEEDFNPPQSWQFLWDNGGITLVRYSVRQAIYKTRRAAERAR